MFIRDELSQESYVHICEGKTKQQMENKHIEIRLHDISFFSVIYDDNGKTFFEHINYCPYCGCDLEKDAFR